MDRRAGSSAPERARVIAALAGSTPADAEAAMADVATLARGGSPGEDDMPALPDGRLRARTPSDAPERTWRRAKG